MVARIEGFRTREQLGLRPPRSISRRITPQNGGGAVHWGGPRQSNATQAACEQTWRNWQNFHMAPGGLGTRNGAADIAYTAAFTNFGIVMAGRGFGVRTGANGSAFGNQNFYAYVWLGGSGQEPNELALDALDWLIQEGRNNGAGTNVSPHSRFRNTSCPGNTLRAFAHSRNNRDIEQPSEDEREEWEGKVVRARDDVDPPGVRFYLEPGWFPSNPEAGRLPARWGFLGGIHEKRRVGSSWQYMVTNSNGDVRWITASENFIRLADR
jgi:hypothetical protein